MFNKLILAALLASACFLPILANAGNNNNFKNVKKKSVRPLKEVGKLYHIKFNMKSFELLECHWLDTVSPILIITANVSYKDSCGNALGKVELYYDGSNTTSNTYKLPGEKGDINAFKIGNTSITKIGFYLQRCDYGMRISNSYNLDWFQFDKQKKNIPIPIEL